MICNVLTLLTFWRCCPRHLLPAVAASPLQRYHHHYLHHHHNRIPHLHHLYLHHHYRYYYHSYPQRHYHIIVIIMIIIIIINIVIIIIIKIIIIIIIIIFIIIMIIIIITIILLVIIIGIININFTSSSLLNHNQNLRYYFHVYHNFNHFLVHNSNSTRNWILLSLKLRHYSQAWSPLYLFNVGDQPVVEVLQGALPVGPLQPESSSSPQILFKYYLRIVGEMRLVFLLRLCTVPEVKSMN